MRRTRPAPGREDLGIDVSKALDVAVRYWLTPRDALRGEFPYYFLNGRADVPHPAVYNGTAFPPGRFTSNFDFYRLGLAYERVLAPLPAGAGSRRTRG